MNVSGWNTGQLSGPAIGSREVALIEPQITRIGRVQESSLIRLIRGSIVFCFLLVFKVWRLKGWR